MKIDYKGNLSMLNLFKEKILPNIISLSHTNVTNDDDDDGDCKLPKTHNFSR